MAVMEIIQNRKDFYVNLYDQETSNRDKSLCAKTKNAILMSD